MDKELLKRIIEDKAGSGELERFDVDSGKNLMANPSASFTKKVMASLPKVDQRKLGIHIWGLIIGVVLVFVLWGLNGFITPEISIPLSAFENEYFKVQNLELNSVTRVFMMINVMLLLLVIDRVLLRKRRSA